MLEEQPEQVAETSEDAPALAETVSEEPEIDDDKLGKLFKETTKEVEAELEAEGVIPEALEAQEEAVEEQAEVPEVKQVADAPVTLLEKLKELGVEHTYQTEEEAIRGLAEAKKMVGMRDDEAVRWRELTKDMPPEEAQGLLRMYKQEKIRRAEQPQINWNPPPVNQAWLKMPIEELPEDAKRQVQTYVNYVQNRWTEWQMNPAKFVQEVVLPAVGPQMRNMLGQQQQQTRTEVEAQTAYERDKEFLDKHGSEIATLLGRGMDYELAKEYVEMKDGKSGEAAKKADLAKAAGKGSQTASRSVADTLDASDIKTPEDKLDAGDWLEQLAVQEGLIKKRG